MSTKNYDILVEEENKEETNKKLPKKESQRKNDLSTSQILYDSTYSREEFVKDLSQKKISIEKLYNIIKRKSNGLRELKEKTKEEKMNIVQDQQRENEENTFKEQTQFITTYMKWYFSLNETSFLRIQDQTNFVFRRVTISPDCKRIIRLDYDRTLYVIESNVIILQINEKNISYTNMRFSYDSKRIAFYDEGLEEINIWSIDEKKQLWIYKEKPDFMIFSKIGEILGVINEGIIKVFQGDIVLAETNDFTEPMILAFPSKNIQKNQNLVCIAAENSIYVWDLYTKETIKKYDGDPDAQITSIQFFNSDAKILIATSNKQILIWEWNKKGQDKNSNEENLIKIINDHKGEVENVLISQNEKYLYSYERIRGIPKIYVFLEKDGVYSQIDSFSLSVSFSSEVILENKLILAGYDYYIETYDPDPEDNIKRKCDQIHNLQFGKRNFDIYYSPDDSLCAKLVAGSINIFFTQNSIPKISFNRKKTDNSREVPQIMAFSKDNTELAVAFKGELAIYNLMNENDKPKYKTVENSIGKIRYLKNKNFITGHNNGDVKIWLESQNKFEDFPKIHKLCIKVLSINADETYFATGENKGIIILWNLKKKEIEASFQNENELINIVFLKKASKLIFGDIYGIFTIYDFSSKENEQIQFDLSPYGDPSHFDLSYDDSLIAISHLNGTISVWNRNNSAEEPRIFKVFNYNEEERSKIKLSFRQDKINMLVAKSKECKKTINIATELTIISNKNPIELLTMDGKLISIIEGKEKEKEEKKEEEKKNVDVKKETEIKKSLKDDISGKISASDKTSILKKGTDVPKEKEKEKEEKKFVSLKKKESFKEKEGSGNVIFVKDTITGKNFNSEIFNEIVSIILSSDHKKLLVLHSESYILYDLINSKIIQKPPTFKTKKEYYVTVEKNKKTFIIIWDNTGVLYKWKADSNSPFAETLKMEDKNLMIEMKSATAIDISKDSSKILIEISNKKIFILDITPGGELKKVNKALNYPDHLIYRSKFSYKDNCIYSIIYDPEKSFRIVKWDEEGKIIINLLCKQQMTNINLTIEPSSNCLFFINDKQNLEMFSPENEIFIKLTDFHLENDKLEKFFINNKDLYLCFKEKIEIHYDFFTNPTLFFNQKKMLHSIFKQNEIENITESNLYTSMFPFNYNFLQILAYNNLEYYKFQKEIFKCISNKNFTVSFELFFKKDLHGRNCFDIAFLSKNAELLKEFLNFILNHFKIQNLSAEDRKYLDLDFFYNVVIMFEDNPIVNDFINFFFASPVSFPSYPLAHKLTGVILKTFNEPFLLAQDFNAVVKEKESHKKAMNELVLAKCFYLYEFLDYNKELTRRIFKKVSHFAPTNPIFGNEAIIRILQYKWELYAKTNYFKDAGIFAMFIICYVFSVDYLFVQRLYSDSSDLLYYSFIMNLIILCFIFYNIYSEAKQMLYFGTREYFRSFWNYIDFFYIVFVFLSTFLDILSIFDIFNNDGFLKITQSLAIFLAFFRFMSFARGIEGSAFMVKLIIKVLEDIFYFLVLMILFIVSLAFSVFVLQTDYSYTNLFTFNTFFREMLGDLGELDTLNDEVESNVILYMFFVFSTLILTIIMLNLLIAIVSNTFNTVQNTAKLTKIWEKWNIITEIDVMLGNENKQKETKKEYLFFLYNERQIENQSSEIESMQENFSKEIASLKKFLKTEYQVKKIEIKNEE